MLDFARKTLLGLGAALALGIAAPSTAATLGGSGYGPNSPSCSEIGSNANTFANIDVLAGAAFNSTFMNDEAGGNFCFNFKNTSATNAAVTLAVATVNQAGLFWGFKNGVALFSEQFGPLPLWSVAQGLFDSKQFSFTITAGTSIFFDFVYGQAYATSTFGLPQINFTVAATPVPLPAGGLLLIGALGGLAALRRRKAA